MNSFWRTCLSAVYSVPRFKPTVKPGILLAVGLGVIELVSTIFLLSEISEHYDQSLTVTSLIGVFQLSGFVISTWFAGRYLQPRERIFSGRNSCVCYRQRIVDPASSVLGACSAAAHQWSVPRRVGMVWLGTSIRRPQTHAGCRSGRSRARRVHRSDTIDLA